jgi:hypothetical protein
MMILIQNLDEFQTTMGEVDNPTALTNVTGGMLSLGTYMGNDVNRYPPGDPENGYVSEWNGLTRSTRLKADNTNIPKHLGGPV